MLKSLLLYLESAEQAAPIIDFGVSVARQTEARVRGLTLVDTRRSEAAFDCESAAYLTLANNSQTYAECVHEGARVELSRACLKARLNFDIRRSSGNPLEVLPAESRFHDLVIVSPEKLDRRLPPAAHTTLSSTDILQLLQRGVQPLLVLPPRVRPIERVLLAYDGTKSAGQAIRAFAKLNVMRSATHRLLAIGATEEEARASLGEMAEYCSQHFSALETGFVTGKQRTVITSYADKWDADLLVLGLNAGNTWAHRLIGHTPLNFSESLDCALFVQI
jgi:nucleotide-binding universal stress UspA family protein